MNQLVADPETLALLEVALLAPLPEGTRARIVELDEFGLTLLFRSDTSPGLRLGDRVPLELCAAGVMEPTQTLVKVESARELGDRGSEYRCRFVDKDGGLRVLRAFRSLFNRRGEVRVRPEMQPSAVVAHMDGLWETPARVLDLSTCGLGLDLGAMGSELVTEGQALAVEFRLPGESEPIRVSAKVLHLQESDKLRIGLQIDPGSTENLEQQEAALARFVIRELAQMDSARN